MNAKYKKIETMNELIDALRLRIDAYSDEYGAKAGREQQDEYDKTAMHYVAMAGSMVVSTARLVEPHKGEIKIQRVATKKEYRNRGIGSGLIKYVVEDTLNLSPSRIWLVCHVPLKGFYEKCGFKAVSGPFKGDGIMEVEMEYPIPNHGANIKTSSNNYAYAHLFAHNVS